MKAHGLELWDEIATPKGVSDGCVLQVACTGWRALTYSWHRHKISCATQVVTYREERIEKGGAHCRVFSG